MDAKYDVIIIGGGVTGTAALYVLARYTNLRRILLIERRYAVAMVNSSTVNNSQTQHTGEIETNFDLAKALKVSAGAQLLSGFIDNLAKSELGDEDIGMTLSKMVIGVGDAETAMLAERFSVFTPYFPNLRLLGPAGIALVEPKVVEGRNPKVKLTALYSAHGRAIDYRKLSEAFLKAAKRTGKVDTVFDRDVKAIEPREGGYVIKTDNGEAFTKIVHVCAGLTSLLFARSLGHGLEYGLLPVAGSFYRAGKVLNGKVYTVQIPKIPFAAVHGDPATYDRDETRFGPTAKPLPLMERDHWHTFWDYLRTGTINPGIVWSLTKVFADPDIAAFAMKNAAYDLPWIGTRVFLKDARKIVPSLEARDLKLDKGAGGLRGQLVHRKLGLAKVDKIVGGGIIFNMAPSPGASYCLGNAVEDVNAMVATHSGLVFDEARLRLDLGLDPKVRFQGVHA